MKAFSKNLPVFPVLLLSLFILVFSPPSAFSQIVSTDRGVSYPAYGMYNGFNQHSNILECGNHSPDAIGVTVSPFGSDGSALGQISFTIAGRDSFHLILNNHFPISNRYGMFRVDAPGSAASSSLRCSVLLYRFGGSSGIPIAYSFALPVLGPVNGTASGLFNSLNPVDVSAPPAQNYLSLANPGITAFSGTIELYDANGQFLSNIPVTALGSNQRTDVALAHPSGKVIGLYRIVPANASQNYYAFLAIYAPGAADFVYAYAVQSSRGSCSGEPLFISTMGPAYSWVQFANPGSSPLAYTLAVRNSLGTLIHTESRSLPARGHEHLFMNAFLGDNNLGTVTASCGAGSLLVQGANYGRTGPGASISWGYANQIRGISAGEGELVVQPFNSFLGVLSWLRTTAWSGGGVPEVAQLRTSPFESKQLSAFAAFGGSTDLGLFSLADFNRIGSVAASPSASGGEISSELLRVFPRNNGTIGYISLLPPAVADGELPAVSLERVAEGLSQPVAFSHSGDGSGRLFIAELAGRIRLISGGNLLSAPFLDITSRVLGGGEQGLLGIAFHPNYRNNGRFFVYYINNNGDSVIAEYHVAENGNLADASSERIILTVDQPSFTNHKGGQLAFGTDGYLYIALGDGGSGGDPNNRAQNISDVLGKILRIDVNGALPYVNPPDNPFVGRTGADEIYAFGFRNPWRFSFDRLNGRLFAGDVGQSAREEVDIVTKGGNYGWRFMEGNLCFNPSTNCPMNGLTLPIHDYGRDDGITVIGGFVYRGDIASSYFGKYFFGDFGSSEIWTLEEQPGGSWTRSNLLNAGFPISSFGEDEAGELYVLNLNGEVYRIVLSR